MHLSMPLDSMSLMIWSSSAISSSAALIFFFSSRRRHTRYIGDWSSDVCSSDLARTPGQAGELVGMPGKALLENSTPVVTTSHVLGAEQSNSSMLFENKFYLKL